ncbi:unnamed protein product [Didymodactylos carnosus]|uniref:Reverse transcriptase RNase H-like domain-containing protein n=1 Tax=Didymodactylos carnosus TaxID=1234261 RepID=A0A814RHR0_9BILA|nr:unnamed protein product [Didymodactylos carnosus]CAF1134102.1 unnamed protein product [Didymodactylos carnosus]CAF3815939.1 unnamed protein product [Didymodactylos carnosus]CAF3897914.1 unnamed protein product [Didymodactylos carnosus]
MRQLIQLRKSRGKPTDIYAEQNYPVYERELLAIIHALRIWRCYVEDSNNFITKDHCHSNDINNVKKVVTECPDCQNYRLDRQPHEPLEPLSASGPFETWGIDFIGRLPVTTKGNK